jgi:hypothetical protein
MTAKTIAEGADQVKKWLQEKFSPPKIILDQPLLEKFGVKEISIKSGKGKNYRIDFPPTPSEVEWLEITTDSGVIRIDLSVLFAAVLIRNDRETTTLCGDFIYDSSHTRKCFIEIDKSIKSGNIPVLLTILNALIDEHIGEIK